MDAPDNTHQTRRLSLQVWLFWLLLPISGFNLLVFWLILFDIPLWSWQTPLAQTYWLQQVELFIAMNNAMQAVPGWLWHNLTLLGDGLVLLPLVLLWVYRNPQIAAALWATVPIAATFSNLTKTYFAIPRPASVLEPEQFTIIGETVAAHTSLPSGHSLTYAAALFAMMAVIKPTMVIKAQWLLLVCLLLLAVLCLSRVAVGAHWPLDTLAGAILGALAGVLGAGISHWRTHWWQIAYAYGRFWCPPVFLLWAGALFNWALQVHQPLFFISLYASLVACSALVAWPFANSGRNFRQHYQPQS